MQEHIYMKRLIHGEHTEYIKLEKKVAEVLVPVLKELVLEGFEERELKAAVSGIVLGYYFANKMEECHDPLPQNWKYDLKESHIQNIKVYRRVFGVSLKEAKERCDELRGKDNRKWLEF